MSNYKTYRGKIWLKSGGHPVPVQCEATNNQQAKKMIEAQYAGQFKSWSKQMSSN